MSVYVVDANVVIKWYTPEDLSDKADAFLARSQSAGDDLLAPDFLLIELSNVLWKKKRMKELQDPEIRLILDELFNHLGVRLIDSQMLIMQAMAIALDSDCSVYDALYLSVAEVYDAVLVTADDKLIHLLKGQPMHARIISLKSIGSVSTDS